MGGQESAFFEISIEIKSAQPVVGRKLMFNSASCERVFALLKRLFGEQQMRSLADLVQAMLMQRRPGAAPLLGFRRELGPRAGWVACDWKGCCWTGCCIFRILIEILREIKCSWREIRCSK